MLGQPPPYCRVCASTSFSRWTTAWDIEYRSTEESFEFFRCEKCQSVSLWPLPTDRLQTIYPNNYYSYGHGIRSIANAGKRALDFRFFRSVLRGVTGSSLALLDIGGGEGIDAGLCRAADPRITRTHVIDVSDQARVGCEARGHIFTCDKVETASLSEVYDVVLLLNIIEHVEDPGVVMRRIREAVSNRGIVVVKTPNIDCVDAIALRGRWTGLHCPRHWTLFTPRSFTMLCEQAGFDVVSWKYTQAAAFLAGSTVCGLARIRLATVSARRPVVYHPIYQLLCIPFAAMDILRSLIGLATGQMIFLLRPRLG